MLVRKSQNLIMRLLDFYPRKWAPHINKLAVKSENLSEKRPWPATMTF
jgi:hypothetical protein